MYGRTVPRKGGLSIAFAVLGAICLLVADLSTYADRALFDSKSFADRATSTLDDQDVRGEIGDDVTDTLVKAAPNLLATRPIVQATVSGAVASAPFQSLFRDAVEDVHRSLFGRDRDTTVLKVADAGVLVSSALGQVAPGVAKRIPDGVQVELVKFSDDGPDAIGTDLAQKAEDNRQRMFVALLAAVVFFALAILAAPERRRAVWRVGVAVAVVGALVVAAYYLARSRVSGYGDDDQATGAIREIWSAFFLDLRNWNLFLTGTGLVIAAASVGAVRPVSIVPALERAWAIATAVPTEPWRRALRAVVLVILGVIILTSPQAVIGVVVFLAGAAALYTGVTELMRLVLPAPVEKPSKPRRARPRVPARVLAAALGVVLRGVGRRRGASGHERR